MCSVPRVRFQNGIEPANNFATWRVGRNDGAYGPLLIMPLGISYRLPPALDAYLLEVRVSALRIWLRLALRTHRSALDTSTKKLMREAIALGLSAPEREVEEVLRERRRQLAQEAVSIRIEDYGAGSSRLGGKARAAEERTISEIYRRAASPPSWGRLLFRLARAFRPRTALELGANLGIGAAHIAGALALNNSEGHPGRLVTIEGDPTLADYARETLQLISGVAQADTEVVTGTFDDRLDSVCAEYGPFDMVVIDGHHEEEAVLRYTARLWPHLSPGACVILDDVEPGRPVARAFSTIKREYGAQAVHLGKLGLLFAQ